MYIGQKNCVYRAKLFVFYPILLYNKSIEKFPAKNLSLCLFQKHSQRSIHYVNYNRKTRKPEAGANLELIIKKKSGRA